MTEPSNGQNQQQPRPQTEAQIVAQREQVRMLALALGNWREAARQCGLSEGRVLNWVVRYGWKLPKRIEAPHPREVWSPVVGVVTPAESLEERLKQDAEATRVGLSTATRKASVTFAECDGDEVVYVSARLKDVVSSAAQLHGWEPTSGECKHRQYPHADRRGTCRDARAGRQARCVYCHAQRAPSSGRGG